MAEPDRRRVDLLGRLRGGLDRSRRDAPVERFDLDLSERGRSYLKGNRQKVAPVAALAADVDLLLLDEPTSGLDPILESTFQACVDEFRESLTSQPPTLEELLDGSLGDAPVDHQPPLGSFLAVLAEHPITVEAESAPVMKRIAIKKMASTTVIEDSG